MMKKVLLMLLVSGLICTIGTSAEYDTPIKPDGWHVHDMKQPTPDVVAPGETDDAPPADAIVLFDGTNMDAWQHDNPDPRKPKWKIVNGALSSVDKAGYIRTKQSFGSMQLHIEWKTPEKVIGSSQGRGNSGIFLMSQYEIQVLDSYDNVTYADGQAAAVYGQKPPEVNVCRAPGKWQSYDIIFHRPIFNEDGSVKKKATVTVLQNGVLVQDHWEILGITNHKQLAKYNPNGHPDKLPLKIQDHGNPVQFRNIWVRELKD